MRRHRLPPLRPRADPTPDRPRNQPLAPNSERVHCAAGRRMASQRRPMPGPTSIASGEAMGSRLSHAAAPFARGAAGAVAGAEAADAGAMAEGAIGAGAAAGGGGGGCSGAGGTSGSLGASGSGASAGSRGSLGSRARFSRALSMRPGRSCGRSISLLGAGFCGVGAGALAGGVCSRWMARMATITIRAPYHRDPGAGSPCLPPRACNAVAASPPRQKHDAGRMCVPRREFQVVSARGRPIAVQTAAAIFSAFLRASSRVPTYMNALSGRLSPSPLQMRSKLSIVSSRLVVTPGRPVNTSPT